MKRFLFLFLILLQLIVACNFSSESSNKNTSEKAKITFACWNVQTFFDAENDGVEYSEYKDYSKWSKEKYLVRLGRLCQVMTTLNPDVVVFEEIENSAVVHDISNLLAGKTWSKKNNWNYASFAKNNGDAIGCAVFSKFPIENVKLHNLKIMTQCTEQPQMRPLFQFSVFVGNHELVVFANHWKSKSGGEEETEIWRDWQELVCENEIQKNWSKREDFACILCGDFNRDVEDFVCDFTNGVDRRNVVFRGNHDSVKLYSPWFTSGGTLISDIGSYYYKNNWERIDNIFSCGNVILSSFGPKYEGPWADSNGIPIGYKLFNGNGYSDHLPLMCVLVF